MKKITLYILLLLLQLGVISCERQEILRDCACTNSAKIPITVDWRESGVTPKNVTVLFYNQSDGSLVQEHRYSHNSKPVHAYVHLPEGEYTAVIFNEQRNEIRHVGVRGHENLSTLGFYVDQNPDVRTRSTDNPYIYEPGMLAVKTIKNLIVTSELIAYTHDRDATRASSETKSISEMLVGVKPDSKVSWLEIKAHIKGLNNARMPALVDLQNISGGYLVDGDRNHTSPATLQFQMNNRSYDTGSITDGTISTRVALFGVLGDRNSVGDHTEETPIILDILFMLVDKDKTLVSRKIDITDLITFDGELSGAISLTIDVVIDEKLPDVEYDSDSGFGSSLEDWKDTIIVPL